MGPGSALGSVLGLPPFALLGIVGQSAPSCNHPRNCALGAQAHRRARFHTRRTCRLCPPVAEPRGPAHHPSSSTAAHAARDAGAGPSGAFSGPGYSRQAGDDAARTVGSQHSSTGSAAGLSASSGRLKPRFMFSVPNARATGAGSAPQGALNTACHTVAQSAAGAGPAQVQGPRLASLSRVVLVGTRPVQQLVRGVAAQSAAAAATAVRSLQVHRGPASILLFFITIITVVMRVVRAILSTRTRSCKQCSGYGLERCFLCEGTGLIGWEGKWDHLEPCPACLGMRYKRCSSCGGFHGRPLFQHVKARTTEVAGYLQRQSRRSE